MLNKMYVYKANNQKQNIVYNGAGLKICCHAPNDDQFHCNVNDFDDKYATTIQREFRSLDVESRKVFFENTSHRHRVSRNNHKNKNELNATVSDSYYIEYFLPYLGELVSVCLQFYCYILRIPTQMILFHHQTMWNVSHQPNTLTCLLPTFCVSITQDENTFDHDENFHPNKTQYIVESSNQIEYFDDNISTTSSQKLPNLIGVIPNVSSSSTSTRLSREHLVSYPNQKLIPKFHVQNQALFANPNVKKRNLNCKFKNKFPSKPLPKLISGINRNKTSLIKVYKRNANLYHNIDQRQNQRSCKIPSLKLAPQTMNVTPPFSPLRSKRIHDERLIKTQIKPPTKPSSNCSTSKTCKSPEGQQEKDVDDTSDQYELKSNETESDSLSSSFQPLFKMPKPNGENCNKDDVSINEDAIALFQSITQEKDNQVDDSEDNSTGDILKHFDEKGSLGPLERWVEKIQLISKKANNIAQEFHISCIKDIEQLEDQSVVSKVVHDAAIDPNNPETMTKINETDHWQKVREMLKVLDQKDNRMFRDMTRSHIEQALQSLQHASFLEILDTVKESLEDLKKEVETDFLNKNKMVAGNMHDNYNDGIFSDAPSTNQDYENVDTDDPSRVSKIINNKQNVMESLDKQINSIQTLQNTGNELLKRKENNNINESDDANINTNTNTKKQKPTITFTCQLPQRQTPRPSFNNFRKKSLIHGKSSFMQKIAEEQEDVPVFTEDLRISTVKRHSILSQVLHIPADAIADTETDCDVISPSTRVDNRVSFVECDKNKDTNEFVEDVLLEKIDKLELELETVKNKNHYLSSDHRKMSQSQGQIIAALKESQERSRLIERMSLHELKQDITTRHKSVQTDYNLADIENMELAMQNAFTEKSKLMFSDDGVLNTETNHPYLEFEVDEQTEASHDLPRKPSFLSNRTNKLSKPNYNRASTYALQSPKNNSKHIMKVMFDDQFPNEKNKVKAGSIHGV